MRAVGRSGDLGISHQAGEIGMARRGMRSRMPIATGLARSPGRSASDLARQASGGREGPCAVGQASASGGRGRCSAGRPRGRLAQRQALRKATRSASSWGVNCWSRPAGMTETVLGRISSISRRAIRASWLTPVARISSSAFSPRIRPL